MASTYVYTSEELLKFSTSETIKTPNFLIDVAELHNEIKQLKKSRKKSRSESRRFSSFKKEREALASTLAELEAQNGHDEAVEESGDESEDSDVDININEMSSKFYLQRPSAPRRNPKDVNPKFASAVANSLAVTGESAPTSSGSKHPHFRTRRYSSKVDREAANAATANVNAASSTTAATEGDGWISVGPKTHHPRKSFNHDDNGHRKRFNDYNRANRGSFSKFGNNGNASGNGRKKSFASSNGKPTKAELTAALNGTGDFHFNKPSSSSSANAISSDESDDPKKENVKKTEADKEKTDTPNAHSSSKASAKPASQIQVS